MSENHDTPDGERLPAWLLKGFGVGTAAAGLLSPSACAKPPPPKKGARGPEEVPVVLQINGLKRELKIEPRVTLLDALRNRLNLTGPRRCATAAPAALHRAHRRPTGLLLLGPRHRS
jgi:xanthine dehydrogenase YagT iron-sulfur-binding subunit